MSRWIRFPLAALFASTLSWGPAALAQDKSKDEDLEKFLQKVEDTKKPEPAAKAEDAEKKPAGEVSAKDKELDHFLEKLGETKETPAPDDKPAGAGGKPDDQPDPAQKPGQPEPDALKGKEKEIDQHLEELTGRRHKKKQQDGEGSGPLSKVIKEMRDVEERLGKTDTGEDTRKKQAEIVKNLEQLIEQMKSQQGSGKGKMVLVMKPGQQPKPGQPGQQQGTTGGNAPHTKPEKPTDKRLLVGGKDIWGDLPDALRQELDNVAKEEGLPSREELIRRYYLSLSKKTLVREESR